VIDTERRDRSATLASKAANSSSGVAAVLALGEVSVMEEDGKSGEVRTRN
jgi:predicted regulator of Ras-like GTPase activity (Roadblock/LC7/MglB family)